ncbi:alginate O-acetyltransferase AlgX-related protein [Sulfitobacter aestuariivivens]|uniref:alginate O-acetyltransferase AlgX-related protein n=1 Tax=Sulfitobacter aestuariivivens TaxID=2766981 RepID=UPI00361B17D8
MTDRTRHSGLRRLWHAGLLGCLAMVALALAPGKAAAQSAYDCRALEVHGALPAIEGRDGVFFRIDPDMHAYQTLSDESIALIGELSRALRSRGTTLVLMPVPGRGHVLAHQLPAMAQHVGFDPDIATAVHRDVMQRLAGAGIAVADPRRALRQSALAGRMPFSPQTRARPPKAARSWLRALRIFWLSTRTPRTLRVVSS